MTSWRWFTVSPAGTDPFDPFRVAFARRDSDGPPHRCQTLRAERGWVESELLARRHFLGSDDRVLTDLTEDQAARLVRTALTWGRFGAVAPELPEATVSSVVTPRESPVVAGETVHVYAGGVVVAHGGRVVVGSGGRCLALGDARVSLVEDGRVLLADLPLPRAVMVAGALTAETGEAWVGPAVTRDLTGTVGVVRLPGSGEGDRTAEEAWAGLGLDDPPPGPVRQLDPDPASPASWVGPLSRELTSLRARVEVSTGPVGTELLVRSRDPRRTLVDLLARVGLPPALRLDRDSHGDWWLLSDHGLRVHLVRSRRALWGR